MTVDPGDPEFREVYEPPPPNPELVGLLEVALADVPIHEAYLVVRRSRVVGREKVQFGVVACVGGSWGGRRYIAALREALRPFYLPAGRAPLSMGSFANSPVPDAVRAVGIRLSVRS